MSSIKIDDLSLDSMFIPSSRIKTVSVTSGKGGVGKSNVVVNLAVEFAKLGKKVLVLDADFGLANIDILLNIRPKYTIEDFLMGSVLLQQIICKTFLDIDVIPAASGIPEMTELSVTNQKNLILELSKIQKQYDYLLIDTGAGISSNVLRFNASVDEVWVVVTNEPTSITDAYAIMKILYTKYRVSKFTVIVNNTEENFAQRVFSTLQNVTKLSENSFQLNFGGSLPNDNRLPHSVRARKPFVISYPNSKLAQSYTSLAQNLDERESNSFNPPSTDQVNFWGRFFNWSKVK